MSAANEVVANMVRNMEAEDVIELVKGLKPSFGSTPETVDELVSALGDESVRRRWLELMVSASAERVAGLSGNWPMRLHPLVAGQEAALEQELEVVGLNGHREEVGV